MCNSSLAICIGKYFYETKINLPCEGNMTNIATHFFSFLYKYFRGWEHFKMVGEKMNTLRWHGFDLSILAFEFIHSA